MVVQLPNIQLATGHTKSYPGIRLTPIVIKEKSGASHLNQLLWEGIEKQAVEISELKSSSVPTVTVINKTPEPFLAFRGTIIRGGGQNRQILHSFIMPEQKELNVPVQCIQHGRWNPYREKKFSSKSGDVTSSSLRFKSKSQCETWDTITHSTSLSGTSSGTDDYTVTHDYIMGSEEDSLTATSFITDASHGQMEKRQKARNRAQQILKEVELIDGQVGMYVTLIDPESWGRKKETVQLQCMELFASNDIYAKVHRDVLSSFVSDIAMLPEDVPTIEQEHDEPMFGEFLEKIQKAPWQQGKNIGKEERQEISTSKEIFGESIYLGEEMVHMMCSSR